MPANGSSKAKSHQSKPANKRARVEAAQKPKPSASSKQPAKSSKPAVSFAKPTSTGPKKKARIQSPTPATTSAAAKKGKGKPSSISKQSSVPSNSPPTIPSAFTIAVGTYEKLLYGLEGTYPPATSPETSEASTSSGPPKPTLTPVFIFPAHVASVKAAAASPDGGKWLATGGTDETIKVWDLRRRKEVGGLMQHQGSITQLTFVSRTHLISASEDGTIALFHTRDWEVLVTLKGHKGRVNSVAVHPTGKLALSVGKDRALRMWDLMRGKPSASTLLGKEGELVRWSTDGKRFLVQTGNTVDVYRTDMTIIQTITHPSRIHDVRFCRHPSATGKLDEDEVLLVAAEDKKISVYAAALQSPGESVDKPEKDDEEDEDEDEAPPPVYRLIAELAGSASRVKAFETLTIALPSTTPTDASKSTKTTTILASASSDGNIHVYDLSSLPLPSSVLSSPDSAPAPPVVTGPIGVGSIVRPTGGPTVPQVEPVASYDTQGSRLTCLTIAGIDAATVTAKKSIVGKKRSRDEDDEADEEEEEEGEGEDGSDVDSLEAAVREMEANESG